MVNLTAKVVILGSGWLLFLLALVTPAHTTEPLYVGCETVTPIATWTATLPPTSTGVPTRTTVPLATPTLHDLFIQATQYAALQTATPGYNASTAVIATQKIWQPTTPPSSRYLVISVTGINVRDNPNGVIVSSLSYGQLVEVIQITPDYIGGWKWGKLKTGGWVAMLNQVNTRLLQAVP